MTNLKFEKNLADIIINLIVELQKIKSLDINEIDRFMTYHTKTNKGIVLYKEELLQNLKLLKKNSNQKEEIIEKFLDYCNKLEINYLLNYISLSTILNEYLYDETSFIKEEIFEFRTLFLKVINQKKEEIKYFLSYT